MFKVKLLSSVTLNLLYITELPLRIKIFKSTFLKGRHENA